MTNRKVESRESKDREKEEGMIVREEREREREREKEILKEKRE